MKVGWTELLIILFIVLLLFGAKRIPDLMKSLGSGVRSFKDGLSAPGQEPPKPGAGKEPDGKGDGPSA